MTDDLQDNQATIEALIADFYETGRSSDALGEVLLRAIGVAVRRSTHTFKPGIRLQVEDEAPSHIWIKLANKKFTSGRRFQAWCNEVVYNLAVDTKRRGDRLLSESDIRADSDVGPGYVESASGRPGDDAAKGMDDAVGRRRVAEEFEQSLPAAIDRIIFAARFEYLDAVSDTVLRAWCRDAKKPDLSKQLREIHKAPRTRRYQLLAELLGLTNGTVRQRAYRAKKKLLQARFPICGAEE